jgi:hypothetical protein
MLGQKNRWMTDRAPLCAARRGGAGLRARARARIGVAWRISLTSFDADVLPAKTALKLISTTDSFRPDRRG